MEKFLSKGDLMKLVLDESVIRNHDTALPKEYREFVQDKFKECNLEFDSSLYVTDCTTASYKLVNLAELLIKSGKLAELLGELDELKYINKQLEKKLKRSVTTDA